jgi:RHS repeat-associated protein
MTYADAASLGGDTVFEQVETAYEPNGNVILQTTRRRFHDATEFGVLGTPAAGTKARVSSTATYYDAADRPTDVVDVGTNGGAAWTRPATVPARSDTVLVSSVAYDDAGRVFGTTDPRGIETRTVYDLLGRTTKTVENYVDGTVSDTDDKTVEFTYFGPNSLRTLTARLTGGGVQTTEYVYGVGPGDGSTITSNDLLRETRHPDKTTGAASASEADLYAYNALGETISFQDRNDTVHAYSFDVVGRPTGDAVTLAMGSAVDATVLRIETAYDSAGRAFLFTSYDAASSGNVVNQVQREFNGLGQITKEYQSHSGAVDTGTTPKVQYTYSEMTGGANHSRVTSLVHPDGFTVGYQYAAGVNDRISRLTSIVNGATTLESFSYLGLATVVERKHPQPGVDLTYVGTGPGDGGDKYVGLDRFGRVVDHRWKTSSSDLDRSGYGYDRASNRTYKENLVNGTLSELYSYDGLNQLADFQRGTLNGTKDGIVGTPARTQSWDPDALGNFESVTTDGTPESRTHNAQNQLTGVGSNTLTFDANGNLTTDETGRTFGYDAWNRLVTVNSTGRYAYDPLHRRVKEGTRALYYTPAWQVVEERESGIVVARNVWSPVYVDALVLRDRDADASGDGTLEERLYALQDANFNGTALVTTAGDVAERLVQDPFGQVTVVDGGWVVQATSAYAWVYTFQGLRYDATADLHHARNRDYSPSLMRFVSVDPILLDAGDVNLYRFVDNCPASKVDPLGLQGTVVSIDFEFREPTDRIAQLQSRKDQVQYYGLNIPIITTIKGEGDISKCRFKRSVQDYVETTENGKKKVDRDDKAAQPDGPNPAIAKKSQVGNRWQYQDIDAPGLLVTKEYLPAKKKATYRFWVEDQAGNVLKEARYVVEQEIDANGKTKMSAKTLR